jgi:UDP-N-acetylglucosamine--N-acetylmuramyl-(pentapeptide) pyrophosphoryl-undecaprenol N-acetylglucosamine transferase
MKIMLVAGGTGGHVFPAIALGDALVAKGAGCIFVGDKRTEYIYQRNNKPMQKITAATLGRGIFGKIKAALMIVIGLVESLDMLREEKPDVVVGFGGYPSFPTVFAAQILGIPTVLHEQNAVFGRANRMLARLAKLILVSFEHVLFLKPEWSGKAAYVGNPVRSNFVPHPYPNPGGPLYLVVTGGSMGSTLFTTIVPAAVGMLPDVIRARLHVIQQVRNEDLAQVSRAYDQMGVEATVAPFFDDMVLHYRAAHVVIARAGASTVAELTAIGRPAIFIPLAISLDGDQARNAAQLVANEAAWVFHESELSADRLAGHLAQLLMHPQLLQQAAKRCVEMGRPTAANDAANLILNQITSPLVGEVAERT